MKFFRLHWLVLLWITESPQSLSGLLVRFLSKEPVYVALGRTLVLRAQFETPSSETIRLVTWDRKDESQEVRLVVNTLANFARISVEMNRQQLKITDVKASDYGIYIVTVTNDKGIQASDSVSVLDVQKPLLASLSLKCNLQSKWSWWDSPTFSWWMDGVEVTNDTAELSADGSTLHLQEHLASNYTCVVDSNQGVTKVQSIRARKAEANLESTPGYEMRALIAVVVIETMVIAGFIGYHGLQFLRRRNNPSTS